MEVGEVGRDSESVTAKAQNQRAQENAMKVVLSERKTETEISSTSNSSAAATAAKNVPRTHYGKNYLQWGKKWRAARTNSCAKQSKGNERKGKSSEQLRRRVKPKRGVKLKSASANKAEQSRRRSRRRRKSRRSRGSG